MAAARESCLPDHRIALLASVNDEAKALGHYRIEVSVRLSERRQLGRRRAGENLPTKVTIRESEIGYKPLRLVAVGASSARTTSRGLVVKITVAGGSRVQDTQEPFPRPDTLSEKGILAEPITTRPILITTHKLIDTTGKNANPIIVVGRGRL